jgi:hypothetical protein
MKYTLLCFLLLSVPAIAQPSKEATLKQSVKVAAKKMDDALIKKDYLTFTETTYPKAVEMTEGGMEKMLHDLQTQMASIEASGNKIIAAWPGNPSGMIDTAGEIQCTIPQFMRMKVNGGTLTTETTLVGITSNKGQKWYFIDAADRDIEKMRMMFPTLSSKHILKKSPEPKYESSETQSVKPVKKTGSKK